MGTLLKPHQSHQKKKILLIAANPEDTTALKLPKEFREIEAALDRATYGDQYDVKPIGATRFKDLRRTLNKYKPHIVHFSGHGLDNGILLEDDHGNQQITSIHSLAELISLTNENIECVILNACDSEAGAEAISQHIDYAIGMNAPVGDQAAIDFSTGFYDGIGNSRGNGCDYKKAFKFGNNAFHNSSSQRQRTLKIAETSKVTLPIITPRLFEKTETQQPSHEQIDEQSNKVPWFYHTIDHDKLLEIDLFSKADNLIFGFFTAKGADAPQSFAIHCCIELLGGRYTLDDDIEKDVHYIELQGMDNNSFENSLLRRIKMDVIQPLHQQSSQQQQSQQNEIESWLLSQRTTVVLHVRVKSHAQQKNINNIIQGAEDTLKKFNLTSQKILTLFSCDTPLPKKWGLFACKPPANCISMGEMRQLTKHDIHDWLETLKAKTQQQNHPEEKLIQMIRKELIDYKKVLSYLQNIQQPKCTSS